MASTEPRTWVFVLGSHFPVPDFCLKLLLMRCIRLRESISFASARGFPFLFFVRSPRVFGPFREQNENDSGILLKLTNWISFSLDSILKKVGRSMDAGIKGIPFVPEPCRKSPCPLFLTRQAKEGRWFYPEDGSKDIVPSQPTREVKRKAHARVRRELRSKGIVLYSCEPAHGPFSLPRAWVGKER